MADTLAKTYNPRIVERDWYERWDEAGAFTPPSGGARTTSPS